MHRITGHEVQSLMEAYSAVYAPQELTEEQVQEDFENWVNSLVEEGYDLSEYTWEDMYEVYLDEGRGSPGAAEQRLSQTAQNAARVNSGGTLGAGGGQAAMRALQSKGVDPRSAYARVYSQGERNIQQAGRQPAQSTGMYGRYAPPSMQQRTPAPTAPTRPAAPVRPPAAPTRPSAAPTRPSATASQKPDAPSTTSTAFNLSRQGVDLSKPYSSTATAPARGPSLAQQAAELRAMQAASRQRQGLTQSFDVFDVIKGHLLGEGYADTEEAALQIMANMSEEWRQSIVEGSAAISANVPAGRTIKVTATGQEPAGEKFIRGVAQKLGSLLPQSRMQSTTVQPRKPLQSTQR